MTESETFQIFMPFVQRFSRTLVFLVLQDVLHHVAEISVAGHHDSFFQVKRRPMCMASQFVAAEVVTFVARVCVFRFQDPFLKSDQSVHEFENGAWRVWRLY